jgi:hypothetical protein
MRSYSKYILIANTFDMNNQSMLDISSWIQNDISKQLKNPHAIDNKISIISFNNEVKEVLPLSSIIDFNFPKIDKSTSLELNFINAIDFLNNKIDFNSSAMIYWIVSDSIFKELLNTRIRETLNKLKEKSIGSIIIRIQDLNNFTLTDFDNWAISCFIGDTFETFIEDMYKKNKQNIIAV